MYQSMISVPSLFWISKPNCGNDNQPWYLIQYFRYHSSWKFFPFPYFEYFTYSIPLHQYVDLKTNLLDLFSCQHISTVFSETPLSYTKMQDTRLQQVVVRWHSTPTKNNALLPEDSSFLGITTLTLNIPQTIFILLK